jgi:hypothetical protein
MHIIRLSALYSTPAVKARKARDGKPARKARPAREGVFPVGHTKFYEDYVMRDESDPYIPGTDVERLRLVHLGEKARGATSDEITRVIEGLQRCSQAKHAAKRDHQLRPAPTAEVAS